MTDSTGEVYLNGRFVPAEQAHVSVMDRGFVFGDGVYEVIPVYGGKLFRVDEHLRRLDDSLTGVRIANPRSAAQWRELLSELVKRHGGGDQSLYLQITRGCAPRDHAFPKTSPPATVFAMSSPLKSLPEAVRRKGVTAVVLDDIRWKYCHLKTINLLPNILLRQQAIERGAAEAILVCDGCVTEGAASNVFIVKDDCIITPAKSACLLPGITRDLVLELAEANGIAYREQTITLDDLQQAAEVWLSSSTKELLPVTRIDDQPVGAALPGPAWGRMLALYQAYKQTIRNGG